MKPANAGKRYPPATYTRDELERLLAALGRGNSGARDRAAVVLMWRCGLRIAEVLALQEHDIDLELGAITVRHGKGDKMRIVGVDRTAQAFLELWLERRRQLGFTARQPIFCVFSGPTKGKAMYSSCLREKIHDAGERAGIGGGRGDDRWGKHVHPHGLRHTFASDLAREKTPILVIQHLLGHEDLRVTSRYLRKIAPWEAIEALRDREWAPVSHAPPPLELAA